MPKKSVREMSKFERMHYSLAARTFHATVMVAIVLALVLFVIGQGLYLYALLKQYTGEAFGLSKTVSSIMSDVVDTEGLCGDVMDVYRGLSDEERAETGSAEYRRRFEKITGKKDYQTLLKILGEVRSNGNVNDIFFAYYDRDTSSIVYIADPDDRAGHIKMPGDSEKVSDKELDTFLNWDGSGMLHYYSKREDNGWVCTAGVPVKSGNGETAGFILADISLMELVNGAKSFFFGYIAALAIVTALVGFILTRKIKKNLVQPINDITQAAQSYVQDKRDGKMDTEHFASLDIHSGDEIENLSLVMADMEHELVEYVVNLTKVTAEKERVTTELDMATRIQVSMLPNIYPAYPERSEFDIYASMDPAREVGGDFYDYFLIDDDHLCMVIADVSGKGVPAALFMMASKIILANNANMKKSPAQILVDTNNAICSNNQMELFVTAWLGILEISTGKLTAANAGHEYPALQGRDGRFQLLKDRHGFVLGGMSGMRYKEYELMIEPGTKLFLYTDGIPEASDADKRQFGTERMLIALNECAGATPQELIRNVSKAVNGFVKDAEQFDDQTMLCVEFKKYNADAESKEAE